MAADRERIAELLEDDARSFRSIGRELGVSDWLVRKTARDLQGDPRPMRQRRSLPQEPAAGGGLSARRLAHLWRLHPRYGVPDLDRRTIGATAAAGFVHQSLSRATDRKETQLGSDRSLGVSIGTRF